MGSAEEEVGDCAVGQGSEEVFLVCEEHGGGAASPGDC